MVTEVPLLAGGHFTVNGVDVSHSLVGVGVVYTFSYTASAGDGDVAVLASAVNVSLHDGRYTAAGDFPLDLSSLLATAAVVIDTTLPVVAFTCGPNNGSTRALGTETVCIACGTSTRPEPWGCAALWINVTGTSADGVTHLTFPTPMPTGGWWRY